MERCLIVSNRLPLTYDCLSETFRPSSGGLVSAIKGLDGKALPYQFEWMGIMDDSVPTAKLSELISGEANKGMRCHPVIVDASTYDAYYNGYCNDVLWPLFHYEHSSIQENLLPWDAYVRVNQLVAKAILSRVGCDDVVWIHDFHFFLVPGILKQLQPNLRVGFFLHIPFPSSEIFRELPQRQDILRSLSRCDLVGFHDLSYLTHYQTSLERVLGGDHSAKPWHAGVYPISIDTDYFVKLAHNEHTLEHIERYRMAKTHKKWILGVDRLDYIKGLMLKLKVFGEYLRAHPEVRGKVEMIQLVIPSRINVPEYQVLKQKIEQLVSSINGEFGFPGYTPVQYLFNSVSEFELSALYQLSDVLYVGSRRDGMNLVCLEYVASQRLENPGVLLLSEFAGAHSSLSHAVSLNPWDVPGSAAKLSDAFDRSIEQRRADMAIMSDFLRRYNSTEWAWSFLKDMQRSFELAGPRSAGPQTKFDWMTTLKQKRGVIFCDFDGTLAPIGPYPADVRITDSMSQLIKELNQKTNCEVVVVSGRDRDFLEREFCDGDLPLAACHGAYAYNPIEQDWQNLAVNDEGSWRDRVLETFNLYAKRTPGSFIEDKGHAITWHYRNSPLLFAEGLARKLCVELEEGLSSLPAVVFRGKKVIEVRSMFASKAMFTRHWLARLPYRPDFVIAIGDDNTDEEMFLALQKEVAASYCVKVGEGKTAARYVLSKQEDVEPFLRGLGQAL